MSYINFYYTNYAKLETITKFTRTLRDLIRKEHSHTHESNFDTFECNKDTQKCDFDTHECDLDTPECDFHAH
jgi:hypothetical protein